MQRDARGSRTDSPRSKRRLGDEFGGGVRDQLVPAMEARLLRRGRESYFEGSLNAGEGRRCYIEETVPETGYNTRLHLRSMSAQ